MPFRVLPRVGTRGQEMAETGTGGHQLEVLGRKVYQAKELIGGLRESNRALTLRLEKLERRLRSLKAVSDADAPDRAEEPAKRRDAGSGPSGAELERLRAERHEIRKRVASLLERMESLEI